MAARTDLPEPLSFSLDEVAELTGFSVRQLKDGCRVKEIPHTYYRSTRVMTVDQIARFLASHEIQPEGKPQSPDVVRIEQHKQRIVRRLAAKHGRAA